MLRNRKWHVRSQSFADKSSRPTLLLMTLFPLLFFEAEFSDTKLPSDQTPICCIQFPPKTWFSCDCQSKHKGFRPPLIPFIIRHASPLLCCLVKALSSSALLAIFSVKWFLIFFSIRFISGRKSGLFLDLQHRPNFRATVTETGNCFNRIGLPLFFLRSGSRPEVLLKITELVCDPLSSPGTKQCILLCPSCVKGPFFYSFFFLLLTGRAGCGCDWSCCG